MATDFTLSEVYMAEEDNVAFLDSCASKGSSETSHTCSYLNTHLDKLFFCTVFDIVEQCSEVGNIYELSMGGSASTRGCRSDYYPYDHSIFTKEILTWAYQEVMRMLKKEKCFTFIGLLKIATIFTLHAIVSVAPWSACSIMIAKVFSREILQEACLSNLSLCNLKCRSDAIYNLIYCNIIAASKLRHNVQLVYIYI